MKGLTGPGLAPLGLLFGAAVRARNALYGRGILRSHEVGAPVISVGNITTGGTGKTPLVEWVARAASAGGRRVCILTRGYGRADERSRVLVSDGERVLADAREGGDEPRLLAEALTGVAAVLSDPDRVAAARWALENLRSDLFILDDGFQHRRIARDLDLVTVDASNPWGGGRLLPAGRLREPPSELARADCVILTRSELAPEIESLRREVSRFNNGRPVLTSRSRTKRLRPLDSKGAESGVANAPSSLAAFCAIGNPTAFFEHLRRDGHTLVHERAFRDHHEYSQADLDAVSLEAKRLGASALVTTAKDAVKLRSLHFTVPCFVLEIELTFDEEGKLTAMLREAMGL